MEMQFAPQGLGKRLMSMVRVDLRRLLSTPLYYIMVGVSFVIPILILVMTTLMDGTTTIDQTTGQPTTIEGFDNVWQAIGTLSGAGATMSMDLVGMCNINMMYFFAAVLVCLFISEDFRSGYAKNLFAVRAKKDDYVISKTLVGFVGGISMLLAFFVGAMLGGAIAGLPFDVGHAGTPGIVMCMLSKLLLMLVFVSIYVAIAVAAKQRAWLSILGSLGVGMLLFMMIPSLTPLNAGPVNVLLCLLGGLLFSVGLGAISDLVLRKTSLV